ncbi:hypothetical protein QC764_0082740 [Podospora pseudoanserina]|uniref:SMODS and SLOG-associating 2TM effector domain-containing protein n=1 Tax=Podospora pseudoanserina TaxID=2609844 RepID=A0ABR0I688_9PEZI|nr:hypothetical protein QC764_0082740 [Podospora pseudoanserina]
MESDSHVEVVERSWLLLGQENPALPSQQGGATGQPELIGVTPTGRMIWLNFDAHRHSAEHYMERYYEHHSRLDLNQPITDLEAALDAAVPGSEHSEHLFGLKVCLDKVIHDVYLMEELLTYVQEVRKETDRPKQSGIPGVAAAGSLATITASAAFLPAKIATWVALSSVGVAVSTVMVGWAIWPRDINRHYETLQDQIQAFRLAVERFDQAEINKQQQRVLRGNTYAHLRSDLMFHWPNNDNVYT